MCSHVSLHSTYAGRVRRLQSTLARHPLTPNTLAACSPPPQYPFVMRSLSFLGPINAVSRCSAKAGVSLL